MESITSEDTYIPGEKICSASHARSGYGTYVRDGFIYASLVGKAKIEREISTKTGENKTSPQQITSMPIVSIKTLKENLVIIPHIGSLVIAKVSQKPNKNILNFI